MTAPGTLESKTTSGFIKPKSALMKKHQFVFALFFSGSLLA